MVTKLKTGTKVGQLGIWDGTQWVAGDPDCNIVKWGGTALTARDITTLLDHLNVDLSTRALEAGGNLAALVAGMNTSKWGGTALTGRDISSDLSKLDVALSTLGRLQPWYQPNFTTSNQSYATSGVAPHGETTRWTYTVPAARIAQVMSINVQIVRDAAATTVGLCYAYIRVAAASNIAFPYMKNNTLDAGRSATTGVSAMLTAGQTLVAVDADGSTGGTIAYFEDANIMEWNT